MYKSKLQVLCQRRSWELPEYTTVKDGPDHMPRFTAAVNVHGQVFETPTGCKSAKEAQNTAAQIAFDHFNAPSSPPQVHRLPQSTSAVTAVNSQVQGVSRAAPPPTVPPVAPPPEMQSDVAVPPLLPLSPLPSSLPTPPPGNSFADFAFVFMYTCMGLLTAKNANTRPSNGEVQQQNCEDTTQASVVYRIATGSQDQHYKDDGYNGPPIFYEENDDTITEVGYKEPPNFDEETDGYDVPPIFVKDDNAISIVYYEKPQNLTRINVVNQLQQYAQKKNFGFPVYTSEAEGPPHARRFKSRVSLDGKSYETLEFFSTLKEAEQAAAKVACQVLSVNVIQEDGGLYKNLLQELAQKKGLLCPSYMTLRSGMSHRPSFVSTVEVGSHTFRGTEAKTKKQAEMNAAKTAYCALMESVPATEVPMMSSTIACAVADSLPQNIQPIATIKKHQDATDEESCRLEMSSCHIKVLTAEAHLQAKRAKSSPENMNVNTHLPGPSHGNSSSDDSNFHPQPVAEQPGEEQPSLHSKTVIFPRKSSLPVPQCASMMPYSDDQWVAYKVGVDQEPTAQI
ncbi:hypothetical protein DH2020_026463 [Rehmannia glutinosa]|uniref:DRBM domain-containing protein n=1 Tax=Rehmannia glutinosa TaxID=99300 RepID=A0ABR0VWU3_REHGL